MRNVWFIATCLALAIAGKTFAQGSGVGGPTVPSASQKGAQVEIERLKAVIRELEREIARLRENAPAGEINARKGDLLGTWLGSVSCGRRQFSITFSINEQFGRVGKGKWAFSGAATGTDDAQISPMPTEEVPDTYMIVTAKPNIFDYAVKLEANTMSGKATQQKCQIHLERG